MARGQSGLSRADSLLVDRLGNGGSLVIANMGVDKAAAIAKAAHQQGISLREAALASGHVTAQEFDAWVVPRNMV